MAKQTKPQVPVIMREATAREVRNCLVQGVTFYVSWNDPHPTHSQLGLRCVVPAAVKNVYDSIAATLATNEASYVFDADMIRTLKTMIKNRYRNTVAAARRSAIRFYVRDVETESNIAITMRGQVQLLVNIPSI